MGIRDGLDELYAILPFRLMVRNDMKRVRKMVQKVGRGGPRKLSVQERMDALVYFMVISSGKGNVEILGRQAKALSKLLTSGPYRDNKIDPFVAANPCGEVNFLKIFPGIAVLPAE